jgi:hypothetical protein
MKLFSTLVLAIFSFVAQAQLDFRLNVDDLIGKKAALNFEIGTDKFSIELGNRFLFAPWVSIGSVDANGNLTESADIKRLGYVGTARANFYTNPKSTLDGFHISPTIDYMRQRVNFIEPTVNNRIGMSIMFGYKYLIGNSPFSVQAEGGLGYWFTDKTKNKITGEVPIGDQFIESSGLGFLKDLRKIRAPFNITVNYRIGSNE